MSKKIKVDDFIDIGCDGTITNTGKINGVIWIFKNSLGKPLQWIICLLHLNELPLRHPFNKLDGDTTGPQSHAGLIVKLLKNAKNCQY